MSKEKKILWTEEERQAWLERAAKLRESTYRHADMLAFGWPRPCAEDCPACAKEMAAASPEQIALWQSRKEARAAYQREAEEMQRLASERYMAYVMARRAQIEEHKLGFELGRGSAYWSDSHESDDMWGCVHGNVACDLYWSDYPVEDCGDEDGHWNIYTSFLIRRGPRGFTPNYDRMSGTLEEVLAEASEMVRDTQDAEKENK